MSALRDGWIEWSGGECPLDPEIEVEWRGRDSNAGVDAAGNLDWRHLHIGHPLSGGDIMAYRIVEAQS